MEQQLKCGTCNTTSPAKYSWSLVGLRRYRCPACGTIHTFGLSASTKILYLVFVALLGYGMFTGVAQPGILLLVVGYAFYKDYQARSAHPVAQVTGSSYSSEVRNAVILGVLIVGFGFYVLFFPERKTLSVAQSEEVRQIKWVQIDSNNKGDSLHIGNIKRTGDLVEYWTRLQFAVPRSIGNMQASVLIDKFVANCADKKFAHRVSSGISNTGQAVDFPFTSPQQQAFFSLPDNPKHPDSIFFRHVCGTV